MPNHLNLAADLAAKLTSSLLRFESNNHDFLRFPRQKEAPRRRPVMQARALAAVLKRWPRVGQSWDALGDTRSRAVFVELLSYWIMGPRKVRLRRNSSQYWRALMDVEHRHRMPGAPLELAGGLKLPRYQVETNGHSVQFHGLPASVLNAFLLEQYAYRQDQAVVETQAGDVVIDAGACWGDTSLYFAARVGPSGRVVALEPDPANLRVFRENLALNPELAKRIEVVERAAWRAPDETLTFSQAGAGGNITDVSEGDAGTLKVTSESIDSLKLRLGLRRIDFIKMDIEGAETQALEGAREVIARDHPKLAICTYHSLDDLVGIPARLAQQSAANGWGYRFFFEHFTIHQEESVLFAR